MACAKIGDPSNCGDSQQDFLNRGPSGRAENCMKEGAALELSSSAGNCTFYGKGNCNIVCGCNFVIKCYDECSSHQYPSDNSRVTVDLTLNTGDIIEANNFDKIITGINKALTTIKLNESVVKSGNLAVGNTILSDDVDDIVDEYNHVFDADAGIISGCSDKLFTTRYISQEFLDVGNIIRARDWNSVIKHILYLSTCCHCVNNYKLVCTEVCVCSCFY